MVPYTIHAWVMAPLDETTHSVFTGVTRSNDAQQVLLPYDKPARPWRRLETAHVGRGETGARHPGDEIALRALQRQKIGIDLSDVHFASAPARAPRGFRAR